MNTQEEKQNAEQKGTGPPEPAGGSEYIYIARVAVRWRGHIRRFTPRTQELYKMVLRKFLAGLPKDLTLNHLATAHINTYINKVLFKSCNATANRHLTVLKSFCRWLSENYDLRNVTEKIRKLPEDPPKQRILSPTEYDKVLNVCKRVEADCIQFLANTGIRATEMTKVRWCDISDDLHWLTVHGKGRKVRMIPLNSSTRSILARYKRKPKSNLVFLKSSTRFQLYRLCQSLARRAAIPRFGPHALRHFFATALYSKGVPVSYISKILGHSSIQTTENIYVHFQYRNLEEVTEVLAAPDNDRDRRESEGNPAKQRPGPPKTQPLLHKLRKRFMSIFNTEALRE